jgi:hypothetical protein
VPGPFRVELHKIRFDSNNALRGPSVIGERALLPLESTFL